MNETTEKLLTAKQVGEILNVHPRTVNLWCEKGIIGFVRLNGKKSYRFKKSDVEKMMQVVNPKPEEIKGE